MGRKIVVVDEERCMGCKSCMIQCAVAHSRAGALVEALNSGESLHSRIHVEAVGSFGMPIQCRHCEDAPCIRICPTEAIRRAAPDDPVLIDQERCIGCKFCMIVCPFGVIEMAKSDRAMVKCDLCIARTKEGEEPACVAACPTKGLKFRDVDEWLTERRRRAAAELVVTLPNRKNEGK